MATTYAAIDLETTGLDLKQDDIIEIGAVRFDAHGNRETFQSFVRPSRPIPYPIRLLTNIDQSDVDGAPSFDDVCGDLVRFLGDAPIIGQNVSFDLAFLERNGVRPPGPVHDTAELARVLLWDTREHSLLALTRYFDIPFPVRHRALADALATADVFLSLRSRALQLPPAVLAELARLASASPWSMRSLLLELALEGAASPEAPADEPGRRSSAREAWPALTPCETPVPVAPGEAVALLRNAASSGAVEGFEPRPQQEQMAAAVASALSDGAHLMVEAGTGTGKSLAYLLPAALYALRNDARIVISTNTINLQEQLVDKDIPALRAMLGEAGRGLRTTQLKGRRNYLCLRRWTALRHEGPYTVDEAKLLARLCVWLPHTETGDRAELNLTQADEAVWARVAAHEGCGPACSAGSRQQCFLQRMRRRAEGAHLIVVNHALLLSDLASGGHVLPDYDHLIIDEAHHLESEATSQFGFSASQAQVGDFLDRLHSGRPGAPVSGLSAVLRAMLRTAQSSALDAGAMGALGHAAGELARTVTDARPRLAEFFVAMRAFVEDHAEASGEYETRLLISTGVRRQPAWPGVEIAWENLSLTLGEALSALERAQVALVDSADLIEADGPGAADECGALLAEGRRLVDGLAAIVEREDPARIAWLTATQNGSTTLHSAPLHVGDALRQQLFDRKRSVVLTSATLGAGEGFGYLRERLGMEEPRELQLGSPFDFRQAALVLLPRDMPEPGQPGYQRAVEAAVLELVRASQGRALVLLTSHAAARATAAAIRGPLEAEGILVQAHGIDGSPRQLIATLRERPRCVVLGTSSFWEGVDVVGDALSLLVMAKLPFAVPTEPVFAARSQFFDDPFNEYALPAALLRFRQGFGRLIRRRTDRGVLALLDGRVRSKSYGRAFVEALPGCRLEELPAPEMGERVRAWLDGNGG